MTLSPLSRYEPHISMPSSMVVRRFNNTLRDPVFEQVQWVITELGLGR